MEMMTLTISLPKEMGTALESKAKTSGKGIAEYVETMIAKQINRPTFRELFADVRASISASDDLLADRIDVAISKNRAAKINK